MGVKRDAEEEHAPLVLIQHVELAAASEISIFRPRRAFCLAFTGHTGKVCRINIPALFILSGQTAISIPIPV